MPIDTKELKTFLHESIENIDDEELLRTVKEMLDYKYQLDNKYQSVSEPELTEYQVKRLDQAKESIRKRETFTKNQADKLVEKWLNE